MDKANIRYASFTRIIHLYHRKVVSVDRHFESLFITRAAVLIHIDHVRKEESGAFLLDGIGQVSECLRNICTVGFRFEFNDLPDDVEQVASSLLGRDELLYLVAEKKSPYLIIVDYG